MVFPSSHRLRHNAQRLAVSYRMPNGLELSRPASSWGVSRTRFAAAGQVGSIELLGGVAFEHAVHTVLQKVEYWACIATLSIYVSPEQNVLPLQSGHVL
jgi:hypothetical protein